MIAPHFLFDFDSTITTTESIPWLFEQLGATSEDIKKMELMTESAMDGSREFTDNFLTRVHMLGKFPQKDIQEMTLKIPLNKEIASFIREHQSYCSIVSSNLDVIIAPVAEKLGIPFHSSRALIAGSRICGIERIADKKEIALSHMGKTIAIGDGANDVTLFGCADIAIAFGGCREIPEVLLQESDYMVYEERILCRLLKQLL